MRAPEVAVIMPTLGTPARAPLLRRALESVVDQSRVRVLPIVVVNGPERDEALVAALRRRRDVVVVELEEASLPGALRAGRAHVEVEWVAELDDDDELLPEALARRHDALVRHPECQAVVTNGIRRDADGDTLHFGDVASISADPLRALSSLNWLLPGSWLGSTDGLPPGLFDDVPHYLECTYLAVRMASEVRLHFVAEPTVVYHADTPGSESKTLAYVVGQAAALQRIIELDVPADVRRSFENRLAPACHYAARALAAAGQRRAAWRLHRRALAEPGGWHYLPHTAKLLTAT